MFTSFLVGKFVSWLISSFVEFLRCALRTLLRLGTISNRIEDIKMTTIDVSFGCSFSPFLDLLHNLRQLRLEIAIMFLIHVFNMSGHSRLVAPQKCGRLI